MSEAKKKKKKTLVMIGLCLKYDLGYNLLCPRRGEVGELGNAWDFEVRETREGHKWHCRIKRNKDNGQIKSITRIQGLKIRGRGNVKKIEGGLK